MTADLGPLTPFPPFPSEKKRLADEPELHGWEKVGGRV